MPRTLDEAGAYRNLGARPVVVLTHGKPMPEMSEADTGKWEKTWLEMQKDMATWSSHGTQRTISDSHHYIPNDDPDAVIAAIREVVDHVRSADLLSDRPDSEGRKTTAGARDRIGRSRR